MKTSFNFLVVSFTLFFTLAWNYPSAPKIVFQHWYGHIERMANPSTITIYDDQGLQPQKLAQGIENSSGQKRLFWMDPAMLNLNNENVDLLTVLDEVITAEGKTLSEGHVLLPDNFIGHKIMAEVIKANPKDRLVALKQLNNQGAKQLVVKRVDADALAATNYVQYTIAASGSASGIFYHNLLANPLEGGEFAYMVNTIKVRITPADKPAEFLPLRVLHSCIRKSDYQQPVSSIKI